MGHNGFMEVQIVQGLSLPTLSEANGSMGCICNGWILLAYIKPFIPLHSVAFHKGLWKVSLFIHHTDMKKFTNLFEMQINSGMSYLFWGCIKFEVALWALYIDDIHTIHYSAMSWQIQSRKCLMKTNRPYNTNSTDMFLKYFDVSFKLFCMYKINTTLSFRIFWNGIKHYLAQSAHGLSTISKYFWWKQLGDLSMG